MNDNLIMPVFFCVSDPYTSTLSLYADPDPKYVHTDPGSESGSKNFQRKKNPPHFCISIFANDIKN